MATTKIQWATKVWNPVTGCTKISEGCKHCYAEKFAKRLQKNPNQSIALKYRNGFEITLHEESLNEPYEWKKPERIFVCSMGDLFHENIPFSFIAKVMNVIKENSSHTFMVLTKRPEIMAKFFNDYGGHIDLKTEYPNLWLGITAENQQRADERIPILLQITAAVRFVSIEPMLGPIDLKFKHNCDHCFRNGQQMHLTHPCEICGSIAGIGKLDWVICGGETGPGARAVNPDWVRKLRDRCFVTETPFFFKQWGGKNKDSQIDGKEYKQFPTTPITQ